MCSAHKSEQGGDYMSVFSVVFSYIATVIGAGFASGQEMISFFVKYGNLSIAGVFISVIIFGAFAYAVLSDCNRFSVRSYDEYLRLVFPRRAAGFLTCLTFVFSFICFCTMTAGSGAMGAELLGVRPIYGNIIMCALSAAALLMGSKKALKYNSVLGGIIIVGVISCCFYIMGYREHQTLYNITKITASSMSYAGYNLITAGVILVEMSGKIRSERQAAAAGFSAAFIMLVIMFLMWVILSIYYGSADLGEMPMLTMARRQNSVIAAMYAVLLFLSMLTTAIASGEAVMAIGGAQTLPLMLLCAVLLSSAGFSNMVNIAYRICGYAGIILPFYVIIKNAKNRAKSRKSTEIRDNNVNY